MPSTSDIYSVLQGCAPLGVDQDYWDRMMHPLPQAPLVQRSQWILDQCRGRVVTHFGSSEGTLHARLREVATQVIGVDKSDADICCDLDHDPLPHFTGDFLLADILEHLGNPLRLLEHLREGGHRLIVTVPNCNTPSHCDADRENVHIEHVAWYSARVLRTLLERVGWEITTFAWYYRVNRFREGIALVAR